MPDAHRLRQRPEPRLGYGTSLNTATLPTGSAAEKIPRMMSLPERVVLKTFIRPETIE